MTDASAKRIADKYIGRDGGPPAPDGVSERELPKSVVDDMCCVGSYLVWQDSKDLWGGVRQAEAWTAFCRLLNVNEDALRKALRGSV